MRSIAGYFPAVVLLALGLNCGDDQQGPSADGPPFFTATIGGVVWDPDDFVALLSYDIRSTQAVVSLQARRNTADGGSETLFINLFTPDPFSLTSYPLTTGGAGEAAGFFQRVPNPPDPEVMFSTGEEQTGTLRITGANATDSVVSGLFAFEGQNGLTGEVRQFRGEFRVRYEVDQRPNSRTNLRSRRDDLEALRGRGPECRDWMKTRGWEVTRTNYDVERKVYAWRHDLSGGAGRSRSLRIQASR